MELARAVCRAGHGNSSALRVMCLFVFSRSSRTRCDLSDGAYTCGDFDFQPFLFSCERWGDFSFLRSLILFVYLRLSGD